MQIRVTRKDINNGKAGDASNCPVARAVRRATGAREIGVNSVEITVNTKDFPAPTSVKEFVSSFDQDGAEAVKPFTFSLPWKKRTIKSKVTTLPVRGTRALVAAKRTK